MLDLKIINGSIVDGTGRPRFRGDVGVKDGKIVAIGEVAEDAKEVVDATGLVVTPGFIDCHTHYDAQVFWDPKLSPSCFHGVTTAVGGFCGFSIAPTSPEAAAYIKPMLARVEGMPLETLERAVPWGTWSSFGDYLAQLEGKVGINIGFFCGHSAIRRLAMGERAVGRRSTSEELAKMKQLLNASLSEGALGFSTTISPTHNDAEGKPVPSRWADYSELLALAAEVRNHEGTGLELLPDLEFPPEVVELLADFSIAGGRPVNWNLLAVISDDREDARARADRMLHITDLARARGGEVLALTVPIPPLVYLNLHNGVVFDSLPGLWRTIFQTPVAERIVQFKDPEVRARLAADAATVPHESSAYRLARLWDYVIIESEADASLAGRTVGEVAKERGCTAIDAMLDIALADGLTTTFAPGLGGNTREAYDLRADLWRDDRTLIGGSDAGAHLDMIDTFAFSTDALQRGVRQHKVIQLEEVVHLITARPARYFGMVDRGTIAPGYKADLVILDETKVGRGATYMRPDVPGGASRIYADAEGIPHVFVNGVQIVRNGEHTGALPGTVLRSGRDTKTVPINAMQRREERAKEPA